MDTSSLFPVCPALIGMVHLKALPGSPRFAGSLQEVIDYAVADARAVEKGGADGLMIENFFDSPFPKGRSEAVTVSALTACIQEIRRGVSIPFGVNVLRNDALSALSIASVTGASYIRVNVLTHAMVTDQGIIEGCSYELSRLKALLGSRVSVMADVMVKHAFPLGDGMDVSTVAKDTAGRSGADVIVVSGTGTGSPIDPKDAERVRKALPRVPLASGSGISPQTINKLGDFLDIFIVGTWIKKDGRVENPVDPGKVEEIASLLAKRRKG